MNEQHILRRLRSFGIAYVGGELLRCGESYAVCLRLFVLDKNVRFASYEVLAFKNIRVR